MVTRHRLVALALFCAAALPGFAGTPVISSTPAPAAPDDLTLANFFSDGWQNGWIPRSSAPGGAPDMPLFHSTTNFLTRSFRTDYDFENTLGKSGLDNVQSVTETITYGINQRIMLGIIGDYTWVDQTIAPNDSAAGYGALARIQLVDTPTSSDSLTLRVDSPETGINIHTTKLSAIFAGWQDLTPIGARRVGLYYTVQEGDSVGFQPPGQTRNVISYDFALAKTWTKKADALGYLTTFAEFSGASNTDGTARSRTDAMITPGVQFLINKRNLFMLGVDFPVTHPSPYREIYRLTYMYCY